MEARLYRATTRRVAVLAETSCPQLNGADVLIQDRPPIHHRTGIKKIMYTHAPGEQPSRSASPICRYTSFAILAVGIGWVAPAFSQTSPNWEAVSPQTRPGFPGTASSSAW